MVATAWLIRSRADVPPGTEWLSLRERRALADLRFPLRRADWRLGRFAAKAAVAMWAGIDPARVEILAAADGAPEALVDGAAAAVSISLSHRSGRAIAAVAEAPVVVGCDLELIEPRSDAFVAEWLAPAERDLHAAAGGGERDRIANLIWTAKEAAAKVQRAGLRLDVRRAVVTPAEPDAAWPPRWRRLTVTWPPPGPSAHGWWRAQGGYVMTVATDRPAGAPEPLGEATAA